MAEKRMKTANETYHREKYALASKVIEHERNWDFHDHPSVVARINERLNKRCGWTAWAGVLAGGNGCEQLVHSNLP